MTIIVTGGAGFIGSNFIFHMLEAHPEYRIICLDKLTYAGNLSTLKSVMDKPNFRFVKLDICDREGVYQLFEEEHPDIVVNFAAESHVDRSIEDPSIFLQTNIIGTSVLMDACRKFGIKRYHQVSTDEGFSTVSLTADYGDHQLYFVASRGDTPAIDGTTISWSKPSDTFWQNVTLNVEPQTEPSQAVSLQRVATRLRISITDEVPTGLASIAVTPSVWYYGLDYTTGEATDSRTTARTVSVPASYVGTIGQLSASFYCISQSAAWQTNLSITAKGSDDATMASVDITGVPMQRNRITTFSGRLSSASRGVSVSVDDSWDTEYTGTW